MDGSKYTINIATDFSKLPGARFRSDGKDSGEQFYEEKLKPMWKKIEKTDDILTLNLDGTLGYASSFISEVFTRLVKDFKDVDRIKKKLNIISNDEPLLIDTITNIINDASSDLSNKS